MKLKRFELHQTQAGSCMKQRDDGEWCSADDVEKLEKQLADAVSLLDTVIHTNSESLKASQYDEVVRFMLSLDS